VITAWAEDRGQADLQELDAAEAFAELPLLALRMHRGVDWEGLRLRGAALNLTPLVDSWEAQLEPFLKGGLVAREGDVLRLTTRGILMSNGILGIFV
jgi:oxygen-independent coproporphyrinogen-3 oxidase